MSSPKAASTEEEIEGERGGFDEIGLGGVPNSSGLDPAAKVAMPPEENNASSAENTKTMGEPSEWSDESSEIDWNDGGRGGRSTFIGDLWFDEAEMEDESSSVVEAKDAHASEAAPAMGVEKEHHGNEAVPVSSEDAPSSSEANRRQATGEESLTSNVQGLPAVDGEKKPGCEPDHNGGLMDKAKAVSVNDNEKGLQNEPGSGEAKDMPSLQTASTEDVEGGWGVVDGTELMSEPKSSGEPSPTPTRGGSRLRDEIFADCVVVEEEKETWVEVGKGHETWAARAVARICCSKRGR